MAGQMGFWSITERLAEISAQGDPLETLAATVDFEMFRPVLEGALGQPPRWRGGRPPFDAVLKFRMLVLQSLHGLSLERTEYLVRDRLSWMRFCRLGPEDRVPDANTLWDFREALIAAGALDTLFKCLDQAINAAGYLPRGGQILDATLVAAPRQRNTDAEKAQIKEGKSAAEIWPDKPAKARQKDVDGRWTVRHSKAKLRADGSKPIDIAIPVYGYKSHLSIDRAHGIIRRQLTTDAARHDGAPLREGLIDRRNTARDVWADSAYRSAENEDWLADHGMTSHIHRKKSHGRPMPLRTRRANARKSAIRSMVEHVFAQQKTRMGMTIRTIGIARARATVTIANMAFNMTRCGGSTADLCLHKAATSLRGSTSSPGKPDQGRSGASLQSERRSNAISGGVHVPRAGLPQSVGFGPISATTADLDPISGDVPVVLVRGGHSLILNSACCDPR